MTMLKAGETMRPHVGEKGMRKYLQTMSKDSLVTLLHDGNISFHAAT